MRRARSRMRQLIRGTVVGLGCPRRPPVPNTCSASPIGLHWVSGRGIDDRALFAPCCSRQSPGTSTASWSTAAWRMWRRSRAARLGRLPDRRRWRCRSNGTREPRGWAFPSRHIAIVRRGRRVARLAVERTPPSGRSRGRGWGLALQCRQTLTAEARSRPTTSGARTVSGTRPKRSPPKRAPVSEPAVIATAKRR